MMKLVLVLKLHENICIKIHIVIKFSVGIPCQI
jgi:hypothetical protein